MPGVHSAACSHCSSSLAAATATRCLFDLSEAGLKISV